MAHALAVELPDTLSDTHRCRHFLSSREPSVWLTGTRESIKEPDDAGVLIPPAPSPPAMFKLNAQGVQKQVPTPNTFIQSHTRRQARGRRPERRTRRHRQLHASRRRIPAVHGAFMRRAFEDASRPPRMGVRGAQGRVRHGIPGIRPRQGRDGRHGDGIQEAQGGVQLPQGGRRGDDDLPEARVSRGAPQAHPHEQHDRTAEPGDQAAYARGRQPPRRRQRPHARLRAHQVRHRERMVDPTLPGHVPAR